MSFIGNTLGNIVGSITGAKQAAQAGQAAATTQAAASQAGIEETRRQFDTLVNLMQPYVSVGTGALSAQQNLIGLGGPSAQQAAISQIEQSPEFQAQLKQGENAILQNAAATGGLRGGNIQGALAQYRPQLLSQLINQRYSQLGGLTQLGQASAAGQANAGTANAANIANLLSEQGQATAGGQIAAGNATRQTFGDVLGTATAAAKFF